MGSTRQELWQQLTQDTFDLLVVGGGASGAGVALEAALRGLKVALVERRDFSEGTSSRSTKLLHGGVRYLELAVKQLDRVQLNLVRDALHERTTLLRLAPHLSRPLWLLTPLYRPWEIPYYGIGLKLYDLLAGTARLEASRIFSSQSALQHFPGLKGAGLRGAVAYQDGQFDDARFNLALVQTALEAGATLLNYCEATALLKSGGKLTGAVVRNGLTGEEAEVSARVIVNATGPFGDALRQLDDPQAEPILRASSGAHLVLDARYSPPDTGLLIPRTEDGRVLFVLPWQGMTLVGTTDDPAQPVDHPGVSEQEITYMLRQLQPYLGTIPRSEVRAVWSGLRPLIARPQADTARLARDHLIQKSPSGLLTLTGGKWTTYRKMALDLVNYAVQQFGLKAGESRSETHLLVGAQQYRIGGETELAQRFSLTPQVAHTLYHTYGDRADQVATLGIQPLVEGWPMTEGQVIYAARHEQAQTPMDVLARRTRLAFLDQPAAHRALPQVGQLLAQELGWDASETDRQIHLTRQMLDTAI
jgi:glycerol-3-phosphate dehydrogenase